MSQVDDLLERLAGRSTSPRRPDRRAPAPAPAGRATAARRRAGARVSTRLEVARRGGGGADRGLGRAGRLGGQARWIPFTRRADHRRRRSGLGVRVAALSGFWLGPAAGRPARPLRRHRLDAAPDGGRAELEVLHLGPYFTGRGCFPARPAAGGTTIRRRAVHLPRGRLVDPLAPLALPVMRVGVRGRAWPARAGRRRPVSRRRERRPGPDGRALPVGPRHAGLRGLPRRRVGPAGRTVAGLFERLTLEAFQSGSELDHHPAQARELPPGVRRLRPGAVAAFDRRTGAVDGRHRDRPQRPRSRPPCTTPGWWPTWAGVRRSCWLRPARPAAPGPGEVPAADPEVEALAARAQAARDPVRRADHRVRADAGGRSGRRPPGRLRYGRPGSAAERGPALGQERLDGGPVVLRAAGAPHPLAFERQRLRERPGRGVGDGLPDRGVGQRRSRGQFGGHLGDPVGELLVGHHLGGQADRSASSASSVRGRSSSSSARAGPTSRGSVQDVPVSRASPMPAKARLIPASALMMRRSASRASEAPAPAAMPLTPATTGLGIACRARAIGM